MKPVRYRDYAENPYFPKRRNRRAIFLFSGLFALLVTGFSLLLWGPWFRVTLVAVQGNEYVQTAEIERRAFEALEQNYLWILPKNNTLFFSKSAIEHALTGSLAETHALERLAVTPYIPIGLTVAMKERVPNLVYVVNAQRYYLDRKGILTERLEGERTAGDFPVLHDQNSRTVTMGEEVARGAFLEYLFSLDAKLAERGITVKDYYIPPISCFAFEKPVREAMPETDEEGSGETKTNENANVNMNANVAPVSRLPELVWEACKGDNAYLNNKELRVRTEERWQIYTRTDQDPAEHVERLLFVLEKKNINRDALKYIDLRFGDTVVYQ